MYAPVLNVEACFRAVHCVSMPDGPVEHNHRTCLTAGQNLPKISLRFLPGTLTNAGERRLNSMNLTNNHGRIGHGDINGKDLWRELGLDKNGRIVVRATPRVGATDISSIADLCAPGGAKLGSLGQNYQFALTSGAINVDLRVTLIADAGQSLTMGDTQEGFLGLRLADQFRQDRGAVLMNSDGLKTTEKIWAKRGLWVDYSTVKDGKGVGITILDHPSNPHHPPYWHARGYGFNAANPFGALDFSGDKALNGSLEIPTGEKVLFRYRVLIHDGMGTMDQIVAWYDLYIRE